MDLEEVLKKLESLANPTKKNIEGMARFGIRPKTKLLCISMPKLRELAKEIGKDHDLALKLWDLEIHEARILAGLIEDPEAIDELQMDTWVDGFDSWDICDQLCMNLFWQTKYVFSKIQKWAKSEKEFTRRTAFSLIAVLAVKEKNMKDEDFIKFFPLIRKYSADERNFVMKSVNWALRQIGKRNKNLSREAMKLCGEIKRINTKSSRWIASNALAELTKKHGKYN